MAKKERGVLLDDSTILIANGTNVMTFVGCDLEHLEMDGIAPGDFVSFSRVKGSTHAENIREATASAKEQTTFAPIFARVTAELAARKKATTKAKQPAPSKQARLVEPTFRTLVDLGLLPPTANLDATTKAIAPKGAVDASLVARILDHHKAPRFVTYYRSEDSWFAERLDATLEDLPVRVALVAASFAQGHQIAFRTGRKRIEAAWFHASDDMVIRLDAHLAAHASPRRVHRLPFGIHAVVLATPAESTALTTAANALPPFVAKRRP